MNLPPRPTSGGLLLALTIVLIFWILYLTFAGYQP